jgi:hypothetical protein
MRFEAWYCQTTQVAKRVMLLLDMSDSMRGGGRLETGRQAVTTLLRTLTPQDSVNVHLIGGSTPGLPSFARQGLIPATTYNIDRLCQFLAGADAMGRQEVSQALAESLGLLDVVTAVTGSKQTAEPRPPAIKNVVFVVSDGDLLANDLALYADGSRLDGRRG